ncbi:MAG TPA: acetyl-coenzyme A synthetase N-terminal domain-containing protein, partial [Usitatibacter sp.]|nr:acetyl-coenzyme A synthetase N-terminal domain-containing protein [Usitatibacter sp.]
MQDRPLWTPSPDRIASAAMTAFTKQVNAKHGLALGGYDELWKWSTADLESFWTAMWDFGGVVAQARGERVLVDGDKMPGARFFPDAKLNFAENLLGRDDDTEAIVFRG